jgi:glycosyltransferase involved in cell wall biosynthesis
LIGDIWPEVTSSAAGLRTRNLVQTFLREEWRVSFISPSPFNAHAVALQTIGVDIHTYLPNDPSFDGWIAKHPPDFVIFDRFNTEEKFGWRVRQFAPDARRIIDAQDLHFLRTARQRSLELNTSPPDLLRCNFSFSHEDAFRELGSIYSSDLTLLLSDFERDLLIQKFNCPSNLLALGRFHYPPPSAPVLSFDDRHGFAWIGNFRHPPNADAVRWFRKDIWPLIRQRMNLAEVFIYGAYPTREVMKLNDRAQGFYVVGSTPDQFQALGKHRVNLAPLRFGAGIKGKITDGWYVGTPVVTTSVGAEGMHEGNPWGGLVADDPLEFAQAAIELYSNAAIWASAQLRGYHLLRLLYDETKNSRQLVQTFRNLLNPQLPSRDPDFFGALLKFHHHRGTRYFSKWIEEKNRNLNRAEQAKDPVKSN